MDFQRFLEVDFGLLDDRLKGGFCRVPGRRVTEKGLSWSKRNRFDGLNNIIYNVAPYVTIALMIF